MKTMKNKTRQLSLPSFSICPSSHDALMMITTNTKMMMTTTTTKDERI